MGTTSSAKPPVEVSSMDAGWVWAGDGVTSLSEAEPDMGCA
jgi:hypothetical protein